MDLDTYKIVCGGGSKVNCEWLIVNAFRLYKGIVDQLNSKPQEDYN